MPPGPGSTSDPQDSYAGEASIEAKSQLSNVNIQLALLRPMTTGAMKCKIACAVTNRNMQLEWRTCRWSH